MLSTYQKKITLEKAKNKTFEILDLSSRKNNLQFEKINWFKGSRDRCLN